MRDQDNAGELEELRAMAVSSRELAVAAEMAVERRMRARMELSQKAAKLKALGSTIARQILAALEVQHVEADEEVRLLVGLAGELSGFGDNLGPLVEKIVNHEKRSKGSAFQEQKLEEKLVALSQQLRDEREKTSKVKQQVQLANSETLRAKAVQQELLKAREEISARAGELMRQLGERDARMTELQTEMIQMGVELQAAKAEAEQGADSIDIDLGLAPIPFAPPPDTGAFRQNPLISASPKLAKEKYAGRASVRIRELLVEEPHHFNELVDVSGLARAEVADCIESFAALGVVTIEQ